VAIRGAIIRYLMLLKVVLWAACCWAGVAITMFNMHTLPKQNGAMCLDGSPYAVYVYQPDPTDFKVIANKLLVYFDWVPNGWCFKTNSSASLERCHNFVVQDYLQDFGSSEGWPSSFFFLNGMLSLEGGGYFDNWPKVFLKNCDGGAFLGNSDPVSFKGRKLYFRGSRNVEEAVAYLHKINFLKAREEVVLAGTFNAAVSALLWSDYFKEQTGGRLSVLVDAAVYLNQMNYKHNQSVIQQRMEQAQKFTLEQADLPNQSCAKANSPNLWKCLFAEELVQHVASPVYFLQSYYDGFGIAEVLGYECAYESGSLSECSKEEREVIGEYHINITKALRKFTQEEKNSAFGIACVGHQFFEGHWDDPLFEVPAGSGHRAITVTSSWAQQKNRELFLDEV
jgi:hypothetical protein